MFARLEFGGYVVEHDADSTAAVYARMAATPQYQCGCGHCRNWRAVRRSIVPVDLRKLLDSLRIPPNAELEVWEVPGFRLAHYYSGWYMGVGRLVAEPPAERREIDIADWKVWFTGTEQMWRHETFGSAELFALQFSTEVDTHIEDIDRPDPPTWVLPEQA